MTRANKDNPLFSIDELESIRDRSSSIARTPMMNPAWKRAYEQLSEITDYIALLHMRANIEDI